MQLRSPCMAQGICLHFFLEVSIEFYRIKDILLQSFTTLNGSFDWVGWLISNNGPLFLTVLVKHLLCLHSAVLEISHLTVSFASLCVCDCSLRVFFLTSKTDSDIKKSFYLSVSHTIIHSILVLFLKLSSSVDSSIAPISLPHSRD